MTSPELSVVIPAHGRQPQLTRAVQSALGQDVDLEVIIVDDGSAPPLVLDSAGARARVLRLDTNSGAAAARNAGVAVARAGWIAFLDSDDVWPENALRARFEVARAAAEPEHTIWAATFTDVWPDGRRATRTPKPSRDVIEAASGCWTCPGSTALFSIEAWRRSGGQDPALRRLEDYEWLFRWIAGGGRIAVHPGVGAEIHRGARATPEAARAAAEYIQAKHKDAPPHLRARMKSYLQLELAVSLWHRDVVGGVANLAQSWLAKPRLQPALERFWKPTK
jgi:glycosyltransferase involved in cell wall biosynthesis